MTATDTPTTASVPQAADPGRQLLDQLDADAQGIEASDPDLYRLGAVVSVLATLIPAGKRSTVCLLDPPADEGAHIEVRARTGQDAVATVASLPWHGAPITRPETLSTTVHHVTRGILWGHRVAVVGVEPIPGGAS